MGQRLGLPPNETTKHLFQRLAICLWKGMHCYGFTDFLHLQHGWMESFNSILFFPCMYVYMYIIMCNTEENIFTSKKENNNGHPKRM